MRRLITLAWIAPLVGLLGGLACTDSMGGGSGTGSLSLVIKDAPGDIKAAVVTISEINLQGSGGATVLTSNDVTTDLLTLSADAEALLQDVSVPAGHYSQLRFVLSGAYIEVDNGNGTSSIYASDPGYPGLPPGAVVTGNLQMPSLGQSGLKVILPGNQLTINDGDQKFLVVDFDVSQSFGHRAGGSGQWVMHPVVKAEDVGVTGGAKVALTLDAGVTLPGGASLGEFTATLTGSDGIPRTVGFADSDGDGTFEAPFAFLTPGDYALTVQAPGTIASFTTTPPVPGSVVVQAGQTIAVSLIVTAAS